MHVPTSQTPSQGPSIEARLREDRLARLHNDEEGQSLIESALVFPVLLLIVTGVLAFGLAFNNYIALTNAVGVGARQLAISRGQTLDPCSTASTAISGAAPLLTSSSITFTYTLNGVGYSAPPAAAAPPPPAPPATSSRARVPPSTSATPAASSSTRSISSQAAPCRLKSRSSSSDKLPPQIPRAFRSLRP